MRWGELKPHIAKLLQENKIADDEPVVWKFPRQLAKRRAQNTEKKCRVCWVTTPENFASFHAARSHVIEEVGNPVIADKLIAEFISKAPEGMWKRMEELGDEAG